jgi:hypothetical protein
VNACATGAIIRVLILAVLSRSRCSARRRRSPNRSSWAVPTRSENMAGNADRADDALRVSALALAGFIVALWLQTKRGGRAGGADRGVHRG